jgi:PAS domain S-box-containing protein
MRALERTLARLSTNDAPEAVLRQRSEVVLSQIAGVAVAVLVANDSARYVEANEAAALLTGYSRAELVTMAVWDLTPTPRTRLGQRLWRDFLRRGRMRGHYQIRQKDGTIVTARYFAIANVLPGLHVSALSTPALIKELSAIARPRTAPAPIESQQGGDDKPRTVRATHRAGQVH